ncbi:hypothetical protein LWM68_39985 [Niabella sp. W65]|nr:hypothetical protein [Niabella sp. W65]MCH7368377.1 hypothetical protein [Niabella sp. W65]
MVAEDDNQLSLSIALTKCNQLYHAGSSARASLIQSYTKLFKSPIEWRGGYVGQMYYRSEFLKHAILSYNIVIDYLLQAIWFGFNFCKEEKITNKVEYLAELRRCSKKTILNEIEKISDVNEKDFLKKFLEDLYSGDDIQKLIQWSHNLKHHENIKIKGLMPDLNFNITHASGLQLSDYIGEEIDLDDAAQVLKNVNNHLKELTDLIFHRIDQRLL